MEIWRDIKGYEGLYKASNEGRIKALDRISRNMWGDFLHKGRILKPYKHKQGYYFVNLKKDKKQKFVKIHRLVALTFIPNPENKPQVNHLDGIKTNNNVTNLEWVTPKENIAHAWETGLTKKKYGEANNRSKFKEEQILYIRAQRGIKTGKELAEEFGTATSVISAIQLRKRWAHI